MPRQALTIEERKAKKQENNRKYFSNAQALQRKRETDRIRKQERRRQDQLIRRDPLAGLADAATQREILQPLNDEDPGPEVNDLPGSESMEEYNEGFEQENGPTLEGGFADNDWNVDEEEQGIIIY